MSDLTTLLTQAQHPDPNIRQPAENQLASIRESNPPAFFQNLTAELANESKEVGTRQLAGLTLKNALTSKNEVQAATLGKRWLAIDTGARNHMKAVLLQTLGSSHKGVRSTASLVISKIAFIEIPQNSWTDLIAILVNNITTSTSISLKQASFEALGYVCEEVPEQLQPHSNLILNAIAVGMKKEETNQEIKLAATIALGNSLEFARANFSNQGERNLIMTMVFTSTQSEDEKVRIAAYQCLVEIAALYYDFLGPYMNNIFQLTATAIQKETDGVSLQAIEFWSTICDEELTINSDNIQAQLTTPPGPTRVNHKFAQSALANLVPLLLQTLTKQSEEVDDDEWIPAMAAGTCLGLMAQTTTDDIVQYVLPWVQQNIVHAQWRNREAAILAFGCILDGPNREKLANLVSQAFPIILKHTKDSIPLVRDTAAWTVGRVCDLIPETISANVLPQLINVFLQGLADIPKVASNMCWAILNLASKADASGSSSPLSQYFGHLISSLLKVTERPDVNESNLLTSAYEAINELIQNSTPDTFDLIEKLAPELMNRLNNTLNSSSTTGYEREKINEVQALLCSSLHLIIQHLHDKIVTPHADTLMTLFLRVLQSKTATVHQEALMAIGALATVVEKGFIKYMSAFKPFLIVGLANAQEHHVCQNAIDVVGDITRALSEDFIPISDDVMKLLLEHLQNNSIEREIKPHIFSVIGDIAIAVGQFFDRYMMYVMRMLEQASTITKQDLQDDEQSDYLKNLRLSILEAYTGIFHALETKPASFTASQSIVNLIDLIVKDNNIASDDILSTAAGLIGDLGNRYGTNIMQVLNRPSIPIVINQALQSDEPKTKENGIWAKDVLQSLGLMQ